MSSTAVESVEFGLRDLLITDLEDNDDEECKEFDEAQKGLTVKVMRANSPYRRLPWYLLPFSKIPEHRPPLFYLAFPVSLDIVLEMAVDLKFPRKTIGSTDNPSGVFAFGCLVHYINRHYCHDPPQGQGVWLGECPRDDYALLVQICDNYFRRGVDPAQVREVLDGMAGLLHPYMEKRGKECVPGWYLAKLSIDKTRDYRLPEYLKP